MKLMRIDPSDLVRVMGGASQADLDEIRSQTQSYCPDTVKAHMDLKPADLNRATALSMADECVGEIKQKRGGFIAGIARGKLNAAIDEKFPK
jgi:hypothetical protein